MNSTMLKIAAVLGVTVCCGAASPADWKFFDYNDFNGTKIYSFYEASTLARRPKHTVQVWTKGLPASELGSVQLTPAQSSDAGSRLAKGYHPPIAQIMPSGIVGEASIAGYEEIANAATIRPKVQMLWEFDCDNREGRTLSTIITGEGSADRPSAWMHLPPQSASANLMTLVCK